MEAINCSQLITCASSGPAGNRLNELAELKTADGLAAHRPRAGRPAARASSGELRARSVSREQLGAGSISGPRGFVCPAGRLTRVAAQQVAGPRLDQAPD